MTLKRDPSTKRPILQLISLWILLLVGCPAIPDVKNLNISGCIKDCNVINQTCLDASKVECPLADTCFDDLEVCFDEANACSDDCLGCEDDFSCADEDVCSQACADKANACTDEIDTCIDLKQDCVDAEVDAKQDCVSDLVDCIAICIEAAEDELKGK